MIWKYWIILKSFMEKCKADHIGAYAAQAAYFIMLSMIPFTMLFISIIRYTPVTKNMIISLIHHAMPDYISPLILSMIEEIYQKGPGLLSITAVVAVWTSAKGIQYLSKGLNEVYDIMETRGYFYLRFRAILYTVVLVVMVAVSLTFSVFGTWIMEIFFNYFPIFQRVLWALQLFQIFLLPVISVFFFMVVYKVLPNRKSSFKSQLPGSVLCAASWWLFSYGMSVYIRYFHGFSMYGSLTTIALMMLWLYFCIYILLICGEINCIFQ